LMAIVMRNDERSALSSCIFKNEYARQLRVQLPTQSFHLQYG
jgi:hypothetical protein